MSGDLKKFGGNVYSQNGEDGILAEIFHRLQITEGFAVEFGAWDGRYLSNAFNLIENKHWRGLFIEGDPMKYSALLKTASAFPGMQTMCAMVGFEGDSSLDRLLAQADVRRDFEMLSIDIDSYDLEVWRALETYRPKVVVIESNAALGPRIVSTHRPPESLYASFAALLEVGKAKGYELVCHNGNCFFVLGELVPALGLDQALLANPERLFDYRKCRKERLINLLRKLIPQRWLYAAFNFSDRIKEARKRERRAN